VLPVVSVQTAPAVGRCGILEGMPARQTSGAVVAFMPAGGKWCIFTNSLPELVMPVRSFRTVTTFALLCCAFGLRLLLLLLLVNVLLPSYLIYL